MAEETRDPYQIVIDTAQEQTAAKLALIFGGQSEGCFGKQNETVHIKMVGPDYQPSISCQILQVEDLVQQHADAYQAYMKSLDTLIVSIREYAMDAEEAGLTDDDLDETERIIIKYAEKSEDLDGIEALTKGIAKARDEFFREFSAAILKPKEKGSSGNVLRTAPDLMMRISVKAVNVVRERYLVIRNVLAELLRTDKAVDVVYYNPRANEYTVRTK